MKQIVKETIEQNLDNYQQIKTVVHVSATKQECSVQKAVYHVMPELLLRNAFPGVIYANSNIPEKRMKMMLTEIEILELPDDSTEVYKRNMLDRYEDRPVDCKCAILSQMCYAEFLRRYRLAPKQE